MADETGDVIKTKIIVEAEADEKSGVIAGETISKATKNAISKANIGEAFLTHVRDNISKVTLRTPRGYYEQQLQKNEKYGFIPYQGKMKISQDAAWELGGIDPSEVRAEIKRNEELQKKADEEAKAAKAKQNAEEVAALKRQRFLNTFKRIGFYRIVRGFFAGIKNIFVQGIQGLAEFDKGANKTVSELLTGYEKLKASIAITIMPLLEAIAPVVTSITNEIADFANNISKASAASKGLTEYTKISDKYVKNMATNSQKLLASFDKFDSLNAKDNPYEKAKMTPEEAKQAVNNTAFQFMEQFRIVGQFVLSLINTLWESIKAIWKGIEPFSGRILKYLNKFSEIIADVVVKVVELSVKFLDFIDSTIGIENFVWSIVSAIAVIKSYKLISSMATLIDKFGKISTLMNGLYIAATAIAGILAYNIFSELMKNMNNTDKTIGIIIGGIVALIASIVALQSALAGDWVGAISSGAAAGIGLGVMIAGIRAKTYANGGIPDKGSLFFAGESGAELVTTMSGGRTGVSNTEQLREAVYGALSDWWSTAQYDIPEQQATYIDTAEIARSKRFKSELNRTNPNLNLV